MYIYRRVLERIAISEESPPPVGFVSPGKAPRAAGSEEEEENEKGTGDPDVGLLAWD